MRLKLFAVALSIVLNFPVTTNSQQTSATFNQAAAVLSQSLVALGGSATVSDITLTGNSERIAGSDDETGTVTYRAVSTANRLDLSLSGGNRSEIRATGVNGPAGNWIGPDGAVHKIAQHNLLTDAGWFPIFTLANLASSTTAVLTYVGPETKSGISVIHIQTTLQQPTGIDAAAAKLYQHLTQMDIYLDASTYRPVALDLNVHPDKNSLQDIPVEFLFSNYTSVGSLNIPFHVQQFLNGSLLLDVQFQQASINSGLSSTSSIFEIQ